MKLAAASTGIGLRAPHLAELATSRPEVGFLEIHAENYLAPHSARRQALNELAEHYPISIHAVGLSLGTTIDPVHLEQVAALIEAVQPALVSEHLAWSSLDGVYYNELLPVPYTAASLANVAGNVDRLQERLKRQVLIENPAAYLRWAEDSYDEPGFLTALVQQTGCGLLVDLNNIHVSASNHGLDAAAYLAALPAAAIRQYHLAGHHQRGELLIDSHDAPVAPAVWQLYRQSLALFGPQPTLIEWDADLPELAVLLAEAATAGAIMHEGWADAA